MRPRTARPANTIEADPANPIGLTGTPLWSTLATVVQVVVFTAQAKKDLKTVPMNIVDKLEFWVGLVEAQGLDATRKIKGFHDEPLHGSRKGQRSIRLSRAYRAIYIVVRGELHFAEVQEVNKHKY